MRLVELELALAALGLSRDVASKVVALTGAVREDGRRDGYAAGASAREAELARSRIAYEGLCGAWERKEAEVAKLTSIIRAFLSWEETSSEPVAFDPELDSVVCRARAALEGSDG